VLRSASIAQADTVVIGTGSDERNLAIARAVLVAATVPRETALDLIVTLDDPALADSVEREDAIVRPTGLARRVRVNLFNPARAAAVALLGSPLWGRRALELHQPRIRLAMIGIGDAAIETALQFLRVSPCCGLDKPRIGQTAHRMVCACGGSPQPPAGARAESCASVEPGNGCSAGNALAVGRRPRAARCGHGKRLDSGAASR